MISTPALLQSSLTSTKVGEVVTLDKKHAVLCTNTQMHLSLSLRFSLPDLEQSVETTVETATVPGLEQSVETPMETATVPSLEQPVEISMETATVPGLEQSVETRMDTATIPSQEQSVEAPMEKEMVPGQEQPVEISMETATFPGLEQSLETQMETATVPGLEKPMETPMETATGSRATDDQMMIPPFVLPMVVVVFILILAAFMGMNVAIVGCLRRQRHLQVAQVEMNTFTTNNETGEWEKTSIAQLTTHCTVLDM